MTEDLKKLETLSCKPKPTIAELEDILEKGGSNSIEIMPNGEIRAAEKKGNCICESYHNRTGKHINGCPALKPSPATLGFNSHVTKPGTRVNKAEDAGQPLEVHLLSGAYPPKTNIMIIAEIEGLISQVNEKLEKLHYTTYESTPYKLITQALEDNDIFQKTTLVELRKALE